MSVAPRDPILELVRENYPVIAGSLLQPLLRLLSLARESCGGDCVKFLIMLVVGVRTTEHRDFARYTQAELLSGEVAVFPSLGSNIRSIADSVGIPKETARRKVAELVEAGWLDRSGRHLRFTAQAYRQLADVRERVEQLAVRNYEIVSRLVAQRA